MKFKSFELTNPYCKKVCSNENEANLHINKVLVILFDSIIVIC